MTAYKNFVQDFPNRCLDILKMAKSQAKMKDREVTLSLVIASAGFVIPFERLRPPGELEHPSGDREKYKKNSENLSKLMGTKFVGSALHPSSRTNWLAGKLKKIEGAPDSWPELTEKKLMSNEKTVGNVLKSIRNALAHGNIYTKGNPIESIIFVGVNTNKQKTIITGYTYISIKPTEFVDFLTKWFTYINDEELSQFEVKELIDSAA